MNFRSHIAVLTLICFSLSGCADNGLGSRTTQTRGTISDVGFFFVGGEEIPRVATGIMGDIDDYIVAHQLAVLTLTPSSNHGKTPVIFLPGFGLVVEGYLRTPDGRPGWANQFVQRGYPVYLVEPSHTTRSGIDSGFYLKKDTSGDTADLFTWGGRDVWQRWGLGPKYMVPSQEGRFPVDTYKQVVAGFTAIETDRIDSVHNIDYQLESNVAGLVELLQKTGPAILLAHSASGVAAFEVAMRNPGLIKAVINVEPVGCPAANSTRLENVAVLSVFGDHMDLRPQMPVRRDECQQTVDIVAASGVPAAMYDLPVMGIRGNSHLMFMENNSSEIADMILDWIGGLDARVGK